MITYTYRYQRIIHYFQNTRPLTKELCPQSEYHHIIPRSLGGTNEKTNLVLLPTRWHYIVHCWLPAVYLEAENQIGYEKMLFAWNRMQNCEKSHKQALCTIKKDSLEYEKLKSEFVQIIGSYTAKNGSENSNYGKHWWKDPNDKTKSMPIKEGDPVPEGWVKGRWCLAKPIFIIEQNTGKIKRHKKNLQIPTGWNLYHKQKDLNCKICGSSKNTCEHPDICKKFQLFPKLIKYFGFNESLIGSKLVYEEFDRIKQKIYDMYFVQKLSLQEICDTVGYPFGAHNLWHFMNALFGKGKLRNFSDSLKNYAAKHKTI